jgi:hypothetical protein
MKALSVAPFAAGAVVLCGVLLSFDASAGSPGTAPPGQPRTLDLSVVPMSITEPGTYVVRRHWDLTSMSRGAPGITAIGVLANDVVIDFQGYQVKFPEYGMGVKVKGNRVTLRNGSLLGGVFSSAIRSSGVGTVIDNMSIYTYEGVQLLGAGAEVRDSDLDGKAATLLVGSDAIIERNTIMSGSGCVTLANNGRLEHNRLQSFADDVVTVRGNRNILADNVLDPRGSGPGISTAIVVIGNGNTLLRNTVALEQLGGAVIAVNGTANVLDANVGRPPAEGPAGWGIRFMQGGNFYGNNRMSAQTPYDVGGLPQTDWGGNVGY